MRRAWRASVALGIFGLVGCGGSGDGLGRVPVEGTVRLDGKPLANGLVTLTPVDRAEPVVTGITDETGRFAIDGEDGPVPGPHRVQIFARKETGKLVKDPDDPRQRVPEVQEVVPRRYNLESSLEADIGEDGADGLTFDLAGAPVKVARRRR